MYAGQVVEAGDTAELLAQPRHPYTEGLLQGLPENMVGGRLQAIPGYVPPLDELPDGCHFAPRCAYARAGDCDAVVPPLVLDDGRAVRCLRTDELDLVGVGGTMSLLEVTGLCKSFPTRRDGLGRVREQHHAVQDVSFTVEPGTTFAIVGESGAGKSTTARLVLGLIEPSAGSVTFDGIDVRALGGRELRLLRRRMQMIFQDPSSSLDPRVSVGESIAEPLVVFDRKATTKAQRAERAAELLERVGLAARDRHKYPSEMSGGQLQRVAIARALTLHPDLIVCDEPVAALDMSVRAQVLNLMKDLQSELELGVPLHLPRPVARAGRRRPRGGDARGAIVEQGPAEQIFAAPGSEYTSKLLAAVPIVSGPGSRQRRARVVLEDA